MKIITIGNQKGGVGKTTTSYILASYIGEKLGKKVLLIDLDAQCNLTQSMGVEPQSPSSYDVLKKTVPIEQSIRVINQKQTICLIPATKNLLSLTGELAMAADNNIRLSVLLRNSKLIGETFDYVIIDTPPTLTTATINAFIASDDLIITSSADYFSEVGVTDMLETVTEARNILGAWGRNLNVAGILITKFKKNQLLEQKFFSDIEEITKQFDTKVFSSKIRESVAVKEAQAKGISLLEYAPKSTAALDYMSFCKEYIGE